MTHSLNTHTHTHTKTSRNRNLKVTQEKKKYSASCAVTRSTKSKTKLDRQCCMHRIHLYDQFPFYVVLDKRNLVPTNKIISHKTNCWEELHRMT